jgi:Fe-S oxidoreductase
MKIGGKHGNKGEEAAITALKMIALQQSFCTKTRVEFYMTIQLFIPCFVDQLFPQTAFNMIKVLEKAGCEVKYNTEQTCCGQPAYNAGFWSEAERSVQQIRQRFFRR